MYSTRLDPREETSLRVWGLMISLVTGSSHVSPLLRSRVSRLDACHNFQILCSHLFFTSSFHQCTMIADQKTSDGSQSLDVSAIHFVRLIRNLFTLVPTLLLAGIALGVDRSSPRFQSLWPSNLVPRATRISGNTAGKERGDIGKSKGLANVGPEEKRIRTFRSVFIANLIPIIDELSYFLPPSQDFVPKISKFFISQSTRHEGWSVEAENISIPALATSANSKASPGAETFNSPASRRGSLKLKKIPTSEAVPFSTDFSAEVLRGPLSPTRFSPSQTSLSATWLWTTRASEVKQGEVTAVKPASDEGGLGAGEAVSNNEQVIMLLSSSPLVGTALGLTLSKTTGLRVLLTNTPINEPDKQFPFALHDSLSAWYYLTQRLGFKPENVTLVGDSIGAGLAVTLHLYLSCLLHSEKSGADRRSRTRLGRPRRLLLHSPRCDHTFSSPSFTYNQDFDVMSPQACREWSQNYLSSILASSQSQQQHKLEKSATHREIARETLNSIEVHGRKHPFFSLGLPVCGSRFPGLACRLFEDVEEKDHDRKNQTKILITAGTHELAVGESRVLAKNLNEVRDVLVEYVEVQDEPYGFAWLLSSSSAKAVISKLTKQFIAEC